MSYGIHRVDDLPEHLREQAAQQLAEWSTPAQPTVRRGEPVPLERDEQAALFAWADAHPVAHVMYANVNGQYRQGQRPEPGMKAGIPDVFLPVARNGKHGLYIELKRIQGGKVSDAQKGWRSVLEGQGYAVGWAYGAAEAIALVENYLRDDAASGE